MIHLISPFILQPYKAGIYESLLAREAKTALSGDLCAGGQRLVGMREAILRSADL